MSINIENPQWICFINGLEVPIISASTSAMNGQLATAQITMPYSPFLIKLPKYSKITLFSFDRSLADEPILEFDGVIQVIQWRKDKMGGNTALFIMAQTDGLIWSARKKFNFLLDNAFGLSQLMSVAQDYESRNATAQSPIFDIVTNIIKSNVEYGANGDGGKAATLFLTHILSLKPNSSNFDGKVIYRDCGASVSTDGNALDPNGAVNKNPEYYANYVKKFYEKYNTLNKVCRIPIDPEILELFKFQLSFSIIMNTMSSLEGEINFWNFATYICDQFLFEVIDIPDACYVKLSKEDMSYINSGAKGEPAAILSEFIIKPKAPFGPIPLCNVIFPDQIIDKSFIRNFPNETTRVHSAQLMFRPGSQASAGLSSKYYQGPRFDKPTDNDYFASFDVGKTSMTADPNSFLKRSPYEAEFGVSSKTIQLNELVTRQFAVKNREKEIQNTVNHEFLITYTDKVAFSLQVTSDVEVVPGMSILALDENGEHILAYCYGREKVWDQFGQYIINLKIAYPRPYNLNTKSISDIGNPFNKTYKTSAKSFDLLSKYLGISLIDLEDDIINKTHSIMQTWQNFNKNTNLTKDDMNAWRVSASYTDFLKFHNVDSSIKYDTKKAFNKMPDTLVAAWDLSSDEAAQMPALQYVYAEDGYKNPQYTDKPNKSNDGTEYPAYYKPLYNELNIAGPLKVSPYISGIVNCHNRYLMQIGNSIT
jgi:hypothetical protein